MYVRPIAGAISLICTLFTLCWFWFSQNGVLHLKKIADGEIQVDVRIGYRSNTLYRLLDKYGKEGRSHFRKMLYVDMIFPALYGASIFSLASANSNIFNVSVLLHSTQL
jgi:hypothetical protein